VRLLGFIIRIYHDAPSSERQILLSHFYKQQMAREAVRVSKCINMLVLMLLQSLLSGFLPYRHILWNGSCLLSEGWFVLNNYCLF